MTRPELPDNVTLYTDTEQFFSRVINEENTLGDAVISFEMTDEGSLKVYVTGGQSPIRFLKLRWRYYWNGAYRFLGDAWERGYGDLEWRGLSAGRFMPWYFCASNEYEGMDPDRTEHRCFGVKTGPNALCFWQADGAGVTLFMDLRNGGRGAWLEGRRLMAANVVRCAYGHCRAFEALKLFLKDLAKRPVFPDFPVYGSNNWYYAYGVSTQEEILKDTDYLVSLTEGLQNRPFMVIDDCWQEDHVADGYNGGPWTQGNQYFPDMKGLAAQIAAKGVRPGIWVRLLQNHDPAIPAECRLLPHYARQEHTAVSELADQDQAERLRLQEASDLLDPTHPAAMEQIRSDVRRICEWGYKLIKHDFSTYDLFGRWGWNMHPLMTADGWHFYDRTLTSAEVVKLFYSNIFEVCKEYGTLVLGCNTIGHLGVGLMHLNRTGEDTSGRCWENTRRHGINTLAFRLPQHKVFYDVDADCVGIDGSIDWKLNRQWAILLAESGTPFFVSVKPGVLNRSEKQELSDLMKTASRQKVHLIPEDWMNTDCPAVWLDEDNGVMRDFQWYEKTGVEFDPDAFRSTPYLSK